MKKLRQRLFEMARAAGIPGDIGFMRIAARINGAEFPTRRAMYEWLAGAPAPTPAQRRIQTQRRERRKSDAAFYASQEWRAVRHEALAKNNGQCELCGRSKREHGIVLHVDHIKPRSLRPDLQLDPNNVQVLCGDCNLGKGNKDDTDWRVGRDEEIARALDAIDWRQA